MVLTTSQAFLMIYRKEMIFLYLDNKVGDQLYLQASLEYRFLVDKNESIKGLYLFGVPGICYL